MVEVKNINQLTDEELSTMGIQVQIDELVAELKYYDYIGTKIAMGVATREEYVEEIAYTETLRKRIRELEELL